MKSRWTTGIFLLFAAALQTSALTMSLSADSGTVKVRSTADAIWADIIAPRTIGLSDSIAVAENASATLTIGDQCVLLLSPGSRLALAGQDATIKTMLAQGQIFLKKSPSPDLASISIIAQGCTFEPMGTAAAVKINKSGEASAAVLQGRMKIDSPSGKSAIIEPGTFATFDAAGDSFKQGTLPDNALKQLEKWSGVTKEEPVQVAQAEQPQQEQQPAAGEASSSPAAPAASENSDNENKPAIDVNKIELPKEEPPAEQPKPSPAAAPAKGQKTGAAKQAAAPAEGEKSGKKDEKEKPAGGDKPQWEISAGSVTVDDAQWTRLALGVDVPIWKFGIFFDLEFFIDKNGKFSDKGWNFSKDNWVESVTRKIRYLRFGHENEPVFAKIGGLSNVSLGYGFVMDRFTNMLHYPDEKLFGVQFYLNDISPIGITIQSVTPNLMEFSDKGGIVAVRAGLKPLKITEIPLLKGLGIAGTYAKDFNQFAPARKWHNLTNLRDKNDNSLEDWDWALNVGGWDSTSIINHSPPQKPADSATFDSIGTHYAPLDTTYRDSVSSFAVAGADISLPIITSSFLNLDVYGQTAFRTDKITGWGFGAPGAKLTVGPFWAQAEYRHIVGYFQPGYFGPYYLDERVTRYPSPVAKSESLDSINLNGIFGAIGLNIANALIIDGGYQYLIGESRTYVIDTFHIDAKSLDQRFEASARLGDLIVQKIPKLSKIEAYFAKTNIQRSYNPRNGKPDGFFQKTPDTYFGYRLGVKISEGAALIWDARYGWKYDKNNKLIPNNNVIIQTAVTF